MNRRTITIASLIYGVSILLSRLVGLVREAVIGRTLGGGGDADVYWTAFVIPDFLNYLLAGGILSIVFIPIFSGYLTQKNEEEGWRVFSIIANSLTSLLAGLTVVLWLAVPSLTPLIAPGMSAEQLVELNSLVRIILPAQIFHLVGGLLSATLQARDEHVMPAIAPLVYTISIVLGGVLFAETIGAAGFAWGVLVGSILGPFGCPLFGCLRHGLHWTFSFNVKHAQVRRYFVLSIPVMLGFSIIVLDDMLIKHFGSSLESGAISQLQYARTLMKVPMGVFGLAAGMAAYPTISRLFAQNEPIEAFKLITDAVTMMIVLALAAQAALTVAGADMAEVIWGRTRFSAEALAKIGWLTGLMSIGLGAWSAQVLVARGFYAQGNTWTPTVIGSVLAIIAYPAYNYASAHFGTSGLALGSSSAILLYITMLFLILRAQLSAPPEHLVRLATVLLRMAIACAAAIYSGQWVRECILAWPPLPRGALAGMTAITLTLVIGKSLGVSQVTVVWNHIYRRIRRRA